MIINTGASAYTLTGGSGVTIPNAYNSNAVASIGDNSNGKYLAVVTNVTGSSEAVTIYPTKTSQY